MSVARVRTSEVRKIFRRYRRVFEIQTEIEFEFKTPEIGSTYSVSYSVRGDKKATITGLPEYLIKDMEEIVALIKLGEIHPLLCTFCFQDDAFINKRIAGYCSMFFELCQPLQDAWAWRIIKKYLPENLFENKIKELINLYNLLKDRDSAFAGLSEHVRRRIVLGTYLVLYSLGFNPVLILDLHSIHPDNSDSEEKESDLQKKEAELWKRYIESLKDFSTKDPDPAFFAELPGIVSAPYRVMIQKSPCWYYEIKELQ